MRSGAAKVCPRCKEIKPISDFKDRSLVTGLGRFCLACKAQPFSQKHVPVDSGLRIRLDDRLLSRSDINKLLSFLKGPEKYTTGTNRAKARVEYLESIKYLFSERQLAEYDVPP